MAAFHPRVEDLPGEFPVFPLSGALLLPRGKLPLRIFEPRYMAMTEDSLGLGRMFGMIQPDPNAAEGRQRARPVSHRLPRPIVLVQRDRRRPVPDHADRPGPLRSRGRDRDAPWLSPRAWRFLGVPADLDLASRPIGVEREALLTALRSYFTHRGIDANWDAIKRLPDDMLVVTLAMVCPFEPAEKQALLEAPDDADRAAALLDAVADGRAGAGHARWP